MEISSKYYSLMAITVILLLGTLANAPDAFAAKPTSIIVQYTTDSAGETINVQKDGGKQNNLDPCDVPVPPLCDTTVTVVNGETFEVLGITKNGAINTELEADTCFFIDDGTEIIFTNKADSNCLHTSCSKPLEAGVTFGTVVDGGGFFHTILVTDILGTGLGDGCMPAVVGGSGFVIDKTALLVSGAQSNAAWMIPVIVSGIGFAVVIARKF